MLLLDKPLVSDFVKESIRQGLFTGLDTGNVLRDEELGLLSEEEVLQLLGENPSHRIHTISENSISWIEQKVEDARLKENIRLFKDKFAFRELISDIYPEFRFSKIMATQIKDFFPPEDSFPFIIKPNIGFFSMGVHKVPDQDKWEEVRLKLLQELKHIQSIYPKAVLDTTEFILEEIIQGDEYAFDAYFNEAGEAVLVGVMHHLFGSETDVSDRVYLTSAEIVNRHKDKFMYFLRDIGKRANLKNFSMHVEARIDQNGTLVPIEINPLRFGAWCTSADLMHYAFNINPYYLYLNNISPDWDDITANMNGDTYGIVILENSTGIPGTSITAFDYDAALANFSDVLEVRKVDFRKYPIFCILFARFKPENLSEADRILQENLKKYLKF